MSSVSILRLVALVGAALFVFCGSTYPILQQTESKAEQLRKYCVERNLTNQTILAADSLAEAADSSARNGNEQESYWSNYRAVVLYRTALIKADLEKSRSIIAQLEEELAQTNEQLKTYEEVLNELDQTRAP